MTMDKDKVFGFLDRAIEEGQLTIRALDVKLGALIAAVLAPLAAISRVFAHIESFYHLWPHWPLFLVNSVFLALWLLALTSFAMAIGAIDNPAIHIPNAKLYKGSFYGGDQYALSWVDAFLNRGVVVAKSDPAVFRKELPSTEEEFANELVFEHMKLMYIRDVKLHRLKWGFRFAVMWLILGICIFLSSRYLSVSEALINATGRLEKTTCLLAK